MNKNSEWASRSRKKALDNGAVAVNVILRKEVAQAMRELENAGYAQGKTALVSRAILDARYQQSQADHFGQEKQKGKMRTNMFLRTRW